MQAWALSGPALERQILEGADLAHLQESVRHFRRYHVLEASGYQILMRSLRPSGPPSTRKRKNQKESTS